MDDLLTLQFPAMADKIQKARESGIADDKIASYLQEKVQTALAAGHSQEDVDTYLGVTPATRQKYADAMKSMKVDAASKAYKLSPKETGRTMAEAAEVGVPPQLALHDRGLWGEIKAAAPEAGELPKPEIPRKLKDTYGIGPTFLRAKQATDFDPSDPAQIVPYAILRAASSYVERPTWALTEGVARVAEGAGKVLHLSPSSQTMQILNDMVDYYSHPELNAPITSRVVPQQMALRSMAYNEGTATGIANDLSVAVQDVIAMFTRLPVIKAGLGMRGPQAGMALRAAASDLPAIKEIAALQATDALLTTPGPLEDRVLAASTRVAGSLTPYIVNITNLTGMSARMADFTLNSFLSSPYYARIIQENGGLNKKAASEMVTQIVMDAAMAWNTRGSIDAQQKATIQRYVTDVSKRLNISESDVRESLETWYKSFDEGVPGEWDAGTLDEALAKGKVRQDAAVEDARVQAQMQAKGILDKATEKAEAIIPNIVGKAKAKAEQKAQEILDETPARADARAKAILDAAPERAEAKAQKVLDEGVLKADEKAAKIIDEARSLAESNGDQDIVNEAQKKAKAVSKEILAKARERAEAVKQKTLNEHQKRAESEREKVLEAGKAKAEGLVPKTLARAQTTAESAAQRIRDKAQAKADSIIAAAEPPDVTDATPIVGLTRSRADSPIRAEVKKMVAEINTATRPQSEKDTMGGTDRTEVEASYQMKIAELLNGYFLKKVPEQQLQVLYEIEDFFKDNPDAFEEHNIAQSDIAKIGKDTLGQMTVGELRELHNKVMGLRAEGLEVFRQRQLKETEQLRQIEKILMAGVGGEKRIERKYRGGANDKPVKDGIIKDVAAFFKTPSRIFDTFDGRAGFKGFAHKVFIDTAARLNDSKARHIDARKTFVDGEMEKLGLTPEKLGEVRFTIHDPVSGEDATYTVQDLIDVRNKWMNPRSRARLMFMGIDSETHDSMVGKLTSKEKAFGDVLIKDYKNNETRVMEAMEKNDNLPMVVEENYTPDNCIRDGTRGTSTEDFIDDIRTANLVASALRKVEAKKGFTFARRDIPPQAQVPLRLGAYSNWLSNMAAHEHYIAFRAFTKQANALIGRTGEPTPSYGETIKNKFGEAYLKAAQSYVNAAANPNIYHAAAGGLDTWVRFIRDNGVVAYLAYNLLTMGKQAASLAYYLKDAGGKHLLLSTMECATNFHAVWERCCEMDPQLKNRGIDRVLEELKLSDRKGFMKLQQKIGKRGMYGITIFDRIAVAIGWNATFNRCKEKGMSDEDAVRTAQRVTLETQPSTGALQLPRAYLSNNEFLNLFLMFSNQTNKIVNIMGHDLVGEIQRKEYGNAFATVLGASLGGLIVQAIQHGKLPESPGEIMGWLGRSSVSVIPVIGNSIVSAYDGYRGENLLGTLGRDIGDIAKDVTKGKVGSKTALAGLELYSLATGAPYTLVKRIVRTAENGNFGELLGWRSQQKAKKHIAYAY